ncbi:hypothetical protein C0J52_18046 [Blattella germanica]|nr:hypothetical protein C0J52_18046 [Blattella germanica]
MHTNFSLKNLKLRKNGRPTISVSDIMGRTAMVTGVSRSTIYRVVNEKKKEGRSLHQKRNCQLPANNSLKLKMQNTEKMRVIMWRNMNNFIGGRMAYLMN